MSEIINTDKIKAVIFDLDGTIADTINSIKDGLNLALDEYGYPQKTYEDVRRGIGNGARLLVERTLPEDAARDEKKVTDVLAAFGEKYALTYTNCRECYAGIPEAVMFLKARGIKLGVLSNKIDRMTVGLIERLFPADTFGFVRGQTELPTKPDPTVPLMAARALGANPSECAFVGDSEVDVRTAKNAGMLSVGVSWGYRGREVLSAEGADIIIDRPEELCGLFGTQEYRH